MPSQPSTTEALVIVRCASGLGVPHGRQQALHCVCPCRTRIRLIFANLTADDILIQDLLDELQATSRGQFQVGGGQIGALGSCLLPSSAAGHQRGLLSCSLSAS